jgi:molybdopterin-guanine dinucleotide biosynthesis protein A
LGVQIFGVILAGGQARRMGGADKAFLPLAGQPLVHHVINRLQPQVFRVIISANGDPARFAGLACDVVADSLPQGPLSGVLAAMHHAGTAGATHLVSTPCDTPFLPDDLVQRLIQAAETAPEGLALARTADGDHPASALWPIALAPALEAFLAAGGAKVTGFADAHRTVRADFSDARAFMNLNSPEDLAAARALLEGRA